MRNLPAIPAIPAIPALSTAGSDCGLVAWPVECAIKVFTGINGVGHWHFGQCRLRQELCSPNARPSCCRRRTITAGGDRSRGWLFPGARRLTVGVVPVPVRSGGYGGYGGLVVKEQTLHRTEQGLPGDGGIERTPGGSAKFCDQPHERG
jgi:hypothetical protein